MTRLTTRVATARMTETCEGNISDWRLSIRGVRTYGAMGKYISKVVPCPGWLSTMILPPWFLMIRSQIGKPNPKPDFFLAVKNGWKIFGRSSGLMPKPVSDTVIATS
jgi:hypothetical protein